jgi:hypothetical protein
MGNSQSSTNNAGMLIVVFVPISVIVGAFVGTALFGVGVGSIAGAALGAVCGVALSAYIDHVAGQATEEDENSKRWASIALLETSGPAGGVLANTHDPSPYRGYTDHEIISRPTPYMADCQFCTELRGGCECCGYSGTYLHT